MSWLPKKNIVVPIDFSDQSFQAVSVALQFVDNPEQVHVIHVLPILSPAEPGMIWDTVDDQGRIRHAKEAIVHQLSGSENEKVNVNVVIGNPGNEIIDFSEKMSAEMIVLPSHGRTGLSRLLIGSVAERVVRLSHCPVLVLRQ